MLNSMLMTDYEKSDNKPTHPDMIWWSPRPPLKLTLLTRWLTVIYRSGQWPVTREAGWQGTRKMYPLNSVYYLKRSSYDQIDTFLEYSTGVNHSVNVTIQHLNLTELSLISSIRNSQLADRIPWSPRCCMSWEWWGRCGAEQGSWPASLSLSPTQW